MRTIVVLEYRTPGNIRLWAWGLLNPDPPGFERVWWTPAGGGNPGSAPAGQATFDRHVFTYTTRESMVTAGGDNSE